MSEQDIGRPGGLSSSTAPEVAALRASIPDAEEWRGTKKQREALRAKFDGRCAYCGGQLGKMHADHLEPVIRVTRDSGGRPLPAAECRILRPERNTVANMMPACAPCNLHKGGYTLEGWRDIIQRSAEISSRATSTFKAGIRFGIITVSERPIQFYFEKDVCETCDGGTAYPLYGAAPHECYWRKGPEFTLGQSTLVPFGPDDCFVPDLEIDETWADFAYPSACGTFYCPDCQQSEYRLHWSRLIELHGMPPAEKGSAQAIEARRAETQSGSVHESAVPQECAQEVSHD